MGGIAQTQYDPLYAVALRRHFSNFESVLAAFGAVTQLVVVFLWVLYECLSQLALHVGAEYDILHNLHWGANFFLSHREPYAAPGQAEGNVSAPSLNAGQATEEGELALAGAGAGTPPVWSQREDNAGLTEYIETWQRLYALGTLSLWIFKLQALRALTMLGRLLAALDEQKRLKIFMQTIRNACGRVQNGLVEVVTNPFTDFCGHSAASDASNPTNQTSDKLKPMKPGNLEQSPFQFTKEWFYTTSFIVLFRLILTNFILAIICDEMLKNWADSTESRSLYQDLVFFYRNRKKVKILKTWPPMERIADILHVACHGLTLREQLRKTRAPRISLSMIIQGTLSKTLPDHSGSDATLRVQGRSINAKTLSMLMSQAFRAQLTSEKQHK
eukprot:gene11111-13129_t